MRIEPQRLRFEIQQTATGFMAKIPVRKNWFVILFLPLWLAGWVMGESSAISQLLKPENHPPQAFLAFWLTGWSIGGIFAILTFLWQVAGFEVIAVESGSLVHRVSLLGLSRTREFRGDLISRLRGVEYSPSMFSRQASWTPPIFGSGLGPVAFDFGAKSYRLGQTLDEFEGQKIIENIASRLPMSERKP